VLPRYVAELELALPPLELGLECDESEDACTDAEMCQNRVCKTEATRIGEATLAQAERVFAWTNDV
jgi:hypothetical protein